MVMRSHTTRASRRPLRSANLRKCSVASRLRSPRLAAGAGLTPPSRFLPIAFIGAARNLERKETPMSERSLTPSISVTIGHHTRLYFAFITTAPVDLDTPATITLLADTLLEVACYAADPFSLDTTRGYAARLVRVDALECGWQCAKYQGNRHLLLEADPRLAGFNTLQQLLWRLLLTTSLN